MRRIRYLLLLTIIFQYVPIFGDIKLTESVSIIRFDVKTKKKTQRDYWQIKWIRQNRISIQSGTKSTIIHLDRSNPKNNRFYYLDHLKQTIYSSEIPVQYQLLFPKSLQSVRFGKHPRIKIKKLARTEIVSGIPCELYHLRLNFMMMNIKISLWQSEGPIPGLNSDIDDQEKWILEQGMLYDILYPGYRKERRGKSIRNVVQKLKGIRVKSVVTMDLLLSQIRIRTQLESAKVCDIPDKIFEIPGNYRKASHFEPGS